MANLTYDVKNYENTIIYFNPKQLSMKFFKATKIWEVLLDELFRLNLSLLFFKSLFQPLNSSLILR